MSGLTLVTGRFYPHSFRIGDLADLEAFARAHKSELFADLEAFVLGHDRVVTLAEVAAGDTDPAAVAVRHDVDHSGAHAVEFARWEHQRGIRSTYFFLPTAHYWPIEARESATAIAALGHEIGLHNDAYRIVGGDPDRALDLMRDQADEMRSWGLEVVGCADHGGGDPSNVDLWRVHEREPGEAGFAYEAYGLHASSGANYVSDNHGRWRAPLADVADRQTHLLVHPCHWALP